MNKILLAFYLLFIFSCSSTKKSAKKSKCPKIYKNKYTEILSEKYTTIYNNDSISYNEIRFECVYSPSYTHKVMYDKFGKWDKMIYPTNKKHPMLLWKDVDLFSDGKKFIVVTNGVEEWKHIYASVMIFDKDENDLLSNNSKEKIALAKYFSKLILHNDHDKKEFYEAYRKVVDLNR